MINKIQKVASMTHKLARLAIDLSVADHKKLKTVASLLGMTMKDFVVVSVGDYVQKKLSKVTKTTLIGAEPKKTVRKTRVRKVERLL
jgi:rRNA processing protein Gar1